MSFACFTQMPIESATMYTCIIGGLQVCGRSLKTFISFLKVWIAIIIKVFISDTVYIK